MIQRNLKVIHRPGGTEGWKDTVPYRTPNWRALLMFVASVFVCGIVTTASGIGIWNWRFSSSESPQEDLPPVAVALDATATLTVVLPFNVAQSQPLPTYTPTPTPSPTPTITPSPTMDWALFEVAPVEATPIPELQLTVLALEERVSQLAETTQEVAIVATPQPVLRHAGVAVVSVDVALIRRMPGVGYRPMRRVEIGDELRLTGISRAGWYEVFYEGSLTGWIWGDLIRIEANQ